MTIKTLHLLHLSRWILVFAISQVSAFEVFKFNDLNKEEVIANRLHGLQEVRDSNQKSNVKTIDILEKNNAKLNNYRRNQDFHGFKYKKLVKRIVPHNYKVNNYEYDVKFNTLFKPLVRVHKKNPKLDRYADVEDPNDLVYVIDDKRIDDVPYFDKDESLLKPFSTDVGIGYLPEKERPLPHKYIQKLSDLNYKPNQSRNKLVDNQGNIESKLMQYISANYKSSKYRTGLFKSKLHEVLRKNPYIVVLYDNIKQHNAKQQKSSHTSKQSKIKKLVIKNKLQKQKQSKTQNVNTNKEPLLFGPTGLIISKQYNMKNLMEYIKNGTTTQQKLTPVIHSYKHAVPLNDLVNNKETKSSASINNPDDLPGALIEMLQNERDKKPESNDRSSSGEIEREKMMKLIYEGVGNVDSKQINLQDRIRQMSEKNPTADHLTLFRQIKDTKEPVNGENKNKFKLLKEIAKYQGNIVKGKEIKDTAKLLKEIAKYTSNKLNKDKSTKHETDEDLRTITHVKSGEEDEFIQIYKKTLDDDDAPTTEPVTWRPNYPFWNYWTYDKQIELDDCKGQLIQHGRICVGPWSKK